MTLAERSPLADFRPPPWPDDFGRRLDALKVLAGVNWQEMAGLLGVTDKAILLWRKGERRPSGANILAIAELARSVPCGIEVLCQSDAGALTLWVNGGEAGSEGRE